MTDESLLIKSCEVGQRPSVLSLLRRVANQASREQKPVLIKAIEGRHEEIVSILLQNGADPNVRDSLGDTALHTALRTHQTQMAETILRHSPNVNEPNRQGLLPIHQAVHRSDYDLVCKLIISGADVNMPNANGQTPLMIACRRGCVQLCVTLLRSGGDLNIKDKNGWTGLEYALLAGLTTRLQSESAGSDFDGGAVCKSCNQRLPPKNALNDELLKHHSQEDVSMTSLKTTIGQHEANCQVRSDRTEKPPFENAVQEPKGSKTRSTWPKSSSQHDSPPSSWSKSSSQLESPTSAGPKSFSQHESPPFASRKSSVLPDSPSTASQKSPGQQQSDKGVSFSSTPDSNRGN